MNQVTGKVVILKRESTSKNGNPRYMISINDIVYYTQVDAMLGYAITNYDGKVVTANVGYHYNKSTIFSIQK